MCHGGDRCTERPRSRAHGYNAGYQGDEERKNEELTTKRLDRGKTTIDEVRVNQIKLYVQDKKSIFGSINERQIFYDNQANFFFHLSVHVTLALDVPPVFERSFYGARKRRCPYGSRNSTEIDDFCRGTSGNRFVVVRVNSRFPDNV